MKASPLNKEKSINFQYSKTLALGLGTTALLVFFFIQVKGVDLKKYNKVLDSLQNLKQIEVTLNQDILKARFGLLNNYDSITQNISRSQKILQALKDAGNHSGKETLLYLQACERTLSQKSSLVEQFATSNATVNNSLRYFPVVMTKLIQTIPEPLKATSYPLLLNQLLRDILLYNLTASEELKPQANETLKQLSELREQQGEGREDFNNALAHAKIILENKKELDEGVSQLVSAAGMKRLDELSQAYNAYFGKVINRGNTYRILLYFFSVCLLGIIGYVMAKLQQNVRLLNQKTLELSKSNKDLEFEIAERKRIQGAMVQSEKMAAIGQMAGGVAHEINNPLGVILGFAQNMVKRIPAGDPLEMPAKSIEREAIRCKNLAQDLLAFSRITKTEKEPVDLKEAVEGALSLVLAQARVKKVDLVKEFSEAPSIMANKNQVQQIIVNLSNNAIDAMPNGGRLAIRLQKTKNESHDGVEIQVQDSGQGIPPDIQSKIFDPFFTTKEVGKGTGLGLALVAEIIQKHSGKIHVQSEVAKGTIFHVFLPFTQEMLEKDKT